MTDPVNYSLHLISASLFTQHHGYSQWSSVRIYMQMIRLPSNAIIIVYGYELCYIHNSSDSVLILAWFSLYYALVRQGSKHCHLTCFDLSCAFNPVICLSLLFAIGLTIVACLFCIALLFTASIVINRFLTFLGCTNYKVGWRAVKHQSINLSLTAFR